MTIEDNNVTQNGNDHHSVHQNGNHKTNDWPIIITDDYIVKNVKPAPKIPDITCAEYLAEKFERFKDNLALIDPKTGNEFTYNDWLNHIKIFVQSLCNFGINESDLVLFFGNNSFQYAITLFAAMLAGIPFSPCTPANGQYEMTEQIKDSHSTFLVIDLQMLHILKGALEAPEFKGTILKYVRLAVVMNCEEDNSILQGIKEIIANEKMSIKTYSEMVKGIEVPKDMKFPILPVKRDDQFMLIYTSGTTGLAKGAIHSNYTALGSFIAAEGRPLTKPQGRNEIVMWYPFGHVSGIFITVIRLLGGQACALLDNDLLENILSYVEKNRISLLFLSSEHCGKLAKNDYEKIYDLSCLKMVLTGGSKVSTHHIKLIKEKYKCLFLESYGSTEFLGPLHSECLLNNRPLKVGGVGEPKPGVELRIVDLETKKNLPPNQRGEICLRGPHRFVGYLRHEEITKSTIDEEGWYYSGDVGYYDEEGTLYFCDRIKEIIKFRVWSLFPAELEDFILRYHPVESVCVVGIKHITDGNLVRAYIKPVDGKKVTEEDIEKSIREKMGFQKRMRGGIRFVKEIPTTAIGKVDRQYFKRLVKDEFITEMVE